MADTTVDGLSTKRIAFHLAKEDMVMASAVDGFKGIQILQKVVSAVKTGAMGTLVGAATAVTGAIKNAIDEENTKKLAETELSEGCPHIEMIDGWAGAFPNMLAHTSRVGGIAWLNGDGNHHWYHHPQESFRPLRMTRAYAGRNRKEVPVSEAGRGVCEACEKIRAQRKAAAKR